MCRRQFAAAMLAPDGWREVRKTAVRGALRNVQPAAGGGCNEGPSPEQTAGKEPAPPAAHSRSSGSRPNGAGRNSGKELRDTRCVGSRTLQLQLRDAHSGADEPRMSRFPVPVLSIRGSPAPGAEALGRQQPNRPGQTRSDHAALRSEPLRSQEAGATRVWAAGATTRCRHIAMTGSNRNFRTFRRLVRRVGVDPRGSPTAARRYSELEPPCSRASSATAPARPASIIAVRNGR